MVDNEDETTEPHGCAVFGGSVAAGAAGAVFGFQYGACGGAMLAGAVAFFIGLGTLPHMRSGLANAGEEVALFSCLVGCAIAALAFAFLIWKSWGIRF